MKEKIKQIAEQAGFVFWQDEFWKPEDEVIDWSSSYDNELEKMVELVVRECLNILNTRNTHAVIVNSIKEIKEHFGVE